MARTKLSIAFDQRPGTRSAKTITANESCRTLGLHLDRFTYKSRKAPGSAEARNASWSSQRARRLEEASSLGLPSSELNSARSGLAETRAPWPFQPPRRFSLGDSPWSIELREADVYPIPAPSNRRDPRPSRRHTSGHRCISLDTHEWADSFGRGPGDQVRYRRW